MPNMATAHKPENILVFGIYFSIFSSLLTSGSALVKIASISGNSQTTKFPHQLSLSWTGKAKTQQGIPVLAPVAGNLTKSETQQGSIANKSTVTTSSGDSVLELSSTSRMSNNATRRREETNISDHSSCAPHFSGCFSTINNFSNLQPETVLSEIHTAAIIYNGSSDLFKTYNNNTDVTSQSVIIPIKFREGPLVSDITRRVISYYFALVVNPIIGILGLATNSLSCIVIVRSGLQKPSNIFLLSLALSDWVCTLRTVNIGWFLTYLRRKMPLSYPGWEMSYSTGFICHVIDKTTVRLSNFAAGMSTSVTVLITIERFIATFFPLRFAAILTPRRAWVALMATAILLLPPYTFKIFLDEYAYFYFPNFNSSMGSYVHSTLYLNSIESMKLFELYFIVHFEFSLPLAIVTIGCALISARISYFRRKRQALVQGFSNRGSARTTNTLLMVCLLYSLTRMCYLFIYLPIFDDTKYKTRNVSYIFVDVRWTLVQVNSACNIVVYVLFNPKFKQTLKELFGLQGPRK